MIRLSVDFEHPSKTWWDAGGRELWEGITGESDGHAVVVDDGLAESWLAQARTIDGWDAGPDYAPHPIQASEVEPDDGDLE